MEQQIASRSVGYINKHYAELLEGIVWKASSNAAIGRELLVKRSHYGKNRMIHFCEEREEQMKDALSIL